MADETSKENPSYYNGSTESSLQSIQVGLHDESSGDNPPGIGMTGPPAGQPVFVYNYGQSPSTVYKSYHNYHSMGLGVTQILVGVLCIIFNSVAIGVGSYFSYGGIGIWGGIMFIVCGSFGIAASKSPTKCKIVTFMVLCIISLVMTVFLCIMSVIGAVFNEDTQCWWYYDYYWSNWYKYCRSTKDAALAMNCMLAILAVVQAAICIWGSVICCQVTCCCTTTKQQHQQQAVLTLPEQCMAMQGVQPMIIVPQPRMNYGGQVAYVQGYPGQQMLTVPAPPYQVNYPMNSAPMMVQSNNTRY